MCTRILTSSPGPAERSSVVVNASPSGQRWMLGPADSSAVTRAGLVGPVLTASTTGNKLATPRYETRSKNSVARRLLAIRHGSVKRCASAVGEGAMAVTFAHRYLSEG